MSDEHDDAFRVYRGDGTDRSEAGRQLPKEPLFDKRQAEYISDDPQLVEAVNVALWVGQPLLVTGEPGVGKTSLAFSVARELGLAGPYEFHTKSTSAGVDLLYRYDAVAHFRDIQRGVEGADAHRYIEHQALGRAIRGEARAVVLIDEIDKGPPDFSNDLLRELDEMAFTVTETGESFESAVRPVVIITSNQERELPGPFLRRCVAHHLELPSRETLVRIARAHFPDLDAGDGDAATEAPRAREEDSGAPSEAEPTLLSAAVDAVLRLRRDRDLARPPSTGELLAWIGALHRAGVEAATLAQRRPLPLLSALLKTPSDLRRARGA